MKVQLIEKWNNYQSGTIVDLADNEAQDLIHKSIAAHVSSVNPSVTMPEVTTTPVGGVAKPVIVNDVKAKQVG